MAAIVTSTLSRRGLHILLGVVVAGLQLLAGCSRNAAQADLTASASSGGQFDLTTVIADPDLIDVAVNRLRKAILVPEYLDKSVLGFQNGRKSSDKYTFLFRHLPNAKIAALFETISQDQLTKQPYSYDVAGMILLDDGTTIIIVPSEEMLRRTAWWDFSSRYYKYLGRSFRKVDPHLHREISLAFRMSFYESKSKQRPSDPSGLPFGPDMRLTTLAYRDDVGIDVEVWTHFAPGSIFLSSEKLELGLISPLDITKELRVATDSELVVRHDGIADDYSDPTPAFQAEFDAATPVRRMTSLFIRILLDEIRRRETAHLGM